MQIEILNDQTSRLFSNEPSNEPFEKRPVMTIQDFNSHSDDHFESHLYIESIFSRTAYFSILNIAFARHSLTLRDFLTRHSVLQKKSHESFHDFWTVTEFSKKEQQKTKLTMRFGKVLYKRQNAFA